MKKNLAWTAAIVSLLVAPACTTTTTSSSDDATDDSDATPDAAGSTPADSAGSSTDDSSSIAADVLNSPAESSTANDGPAGDDGGSCAVGVNAGTPECNDCASTSCCAAIVTCATDEDAGVDDAGGSACSAIFDCVSTFVDADAGSFVEALASCEGAYAQSAVTEATDVLTCLQTNCSSQCAGQ
ncbi:MAG: hypothetical protein ABTD50_11895 [Polyangiaceae bacterium]|jgi:hypothetical protein